MCEIIQEILKNDPLDFIKMVVTIMNIILYPKNYMKII